MPHDTHTQHIMSDTSSFYIRICGCGIIHLCFGSTTINLTKNAVIAVSETLKEVVSNLRDRSELKSRLDQTQAELDGPNIINGNFSRQNN